MKIKRALLSVSDKKGIIEFARGLSSCGVELISTGGTKKELMANNIPVKDISEFTGFPEILDGRVKTLHPLVHGGLLAIRDSKSHQEQVAKNKIEYIDLVCVNLYPFEKTVSEKNVSNEEAIENIDIGGPTMLRSAAKNYRFVTVVVDVNDYDTVLKQIKDSGDTDEATRFELMKKVFAHTARYDSLIANHFTGQGKDFPDALNLNFKKIYSLRYGENPHQKAAWYSDYTPCREASIVNAEKVQGKELSYNNILDAQACLDILRDFSNETFAVIIKHTNPCGASYGRNAEDAFRKAFSVDPTSAFGGIIGLTKEVDAATARAINENFAEIVLAPAVSDEAKKILAEKKNLRVLVFTSPLADKQAQWEVKRISGGLLLQEKDIPLYDESQFKIVTKRAPTDAEKKALLFAWKIAKHVKSNAIVYATEDIILGVGAGQMSRVDSARIAKEKAQRPLAGCAMASDAFFPFRDSIDTAAKEGVKAIIQPGGSVKDAEVIAACDEFGIAMICTQMRHFKH
ncbi:MAG: bifunctional phosphoribosylaminoimidazolecarboxamide formyltransferase/IMP cyclohydrolase [Spirochaetota bacterium]